MTTLATYRSNISAIIGLDNSTTGDRTLIDGWINEGYVQLLRETRGQVRSATFTPGANADVTMDANVLFIVEAYLTSGGNLSRLEKITLEELLQMRVNGANVTASPAMYYAFSAQDLMSFWPTPGATDSVTVYYVPRPSALSVSSDQPVAIPAEWQHLIEFYALWRAGDYDDDASSQQGQTYLGYFNDGVRKMRRDLNFHGRHRLNKSRIPGRSLSRYPPHDNSTDTGT